MCEIDMPCSFQAGDGRPLKVQVAARSKTVADANACRRAFAMLLALDTSNVVLRPTHWKCSETELLRRIAHLLTQEQQPLVVSPPRATGSTIVRQAVAGDLDTRQEDNSMETLRILLKCLDVEGGECDPSRFRVHPDGLKPWQAVDALMMPGSLKRFLEDNMFTVLPKINGKGFTFRFGDLHVEQGE